MTYRGTLSIAVGKALRASDVDPLDAGAAALARRYAGLIDDAVPAAKYGKHLRAMEQALAMLTVLEPLAGAQATESFEKIAEALSAHSVASDLGPKLLATLTALGLTAAGRGAVAPAKGGPASVPAVASKLDELRERRARRAGQHDA